MDGLDRGGGIGVRSDPDRDRSIIAVTDGDVA
jgi:hypothetical protein